MWLVGGVRLLRHGLAPGGSRRRETQGQVCAYQGKQADQGIHGNTVRETACRGVKIQGETTKLAVEMFTIFTQRKTNN